MKFKIIAIAVLLAALGAAYVVFESDPAPTRSGSSSELGGFKIP